MDIRLDIENGWVVIHLSGRIDSFNYDDVTSKIQTLFRMGKRFIALDLTDVTYLGLPSLRFLFQMAGRLQKASGQMMLISPSEKLMKSIEAINHPKRWEIITHRQLLIQPHAPQENHQ
ncbi:MAG: STAS domain-containing protein [Bdellovibrionaceae bacterium]|nr:STAS domain-containing protein [Bdellovibrionales bacterium]MCB9084108.1 STAS domain-containing protein [Pseudobdellovibrionaceae bacterium]